MKKNIAADFKALVTKKYITDMAESHLECWKDRYAGKRKKDVAFDISMNHDDSLEVERTEEELKRKLSDDEYNYLTFEFHKRVPQVYMNQLAS